MCCTPNYTNAPFWSASVLHSTACLFIHCSTTVIASDKTGTLTQNRMTVQHAWYNMELFEVCCFLWLLLFCCMCGCAYRLYPGEALYVQWHDMPLFCCTFISYCDLYSISLRNLQVPAAKNRVHLATARKAAAKLGPVYDPNVRFWCTSCYT